MPLQYINADVTTVKEGLIAHGVNCQRAMGSGVAKAIKEKWPIVYERYMRSGRGKKMLGCTEIIHVVEFKLIVANCYTQVFYGYGGGKYANLQAVDQSVGKAAHIANLYNLPMYLPKIGCGLGGLSWDNEVKPIMERIAQDFSNIDMFVCEL